MSTTLRNTFEGGTNGANITTANSGGASGAAFDTIVYNNAVVSGSGSSSLIYTNAWAGRGSMSCQMTMAASVSYLRSAFTETGTRYVIRRNIYLDTSLPTANFMLAAVYANTTLLGQLLVNAAGHVVANRGSTPVFTSTATLVANTNYYVEFAIQKESATSAGDGHIEVQLYDAANNAISGGSYSSSTQATGTADATYIRWGASSTSSGMAVDRIDDLAFEARASGWIGPAANVPPSVSLTANQTATAASAVTVTATASDSDGSIASYAWTGTRYTAGAAPASITITSGASTATCGYTAGAVGTLDILQCVVTDNEAGTTTRTTEVRVLSTTDAVTTLRMSGTGDTGWSIIGGSATEGQALGDSSSSTRVESPDITSTASTRTWRLAPMTTRSGLRVTLSDVVQTATATLACRVQVLTGASLSVVTDRALTTTTSDTAPYLDLTSGELAAVTDWGDVRVSAVAVL